MTITAFTGPVVSFGQADSSDYNPEAGPSLFYNGQGIADPRPAYNYNPGQNFGAATLGFLGTSAIQVVNSVPYTLSTAAIVASANPTSTSLTLVSASSATTGVAIVPSIVRADTGVIDTGVGGAGLVALDAFTSFTGTIAGNVLTVTAGSNAPIVVGMTLLTAGGTGTLSSGVTVIGLGTGIGYSGTYILSQSQTIGSGTITAAFNTISALAVPFGSAGTIQLWNPQALVARAISITAAASATATSATVSGYDIYGYPMVETITVTAGSAVNGKKAWKYIRSVVLNSSDTTHAYSVGTLDIFGFPIRSDTFGDMLMSYSASLNPVPITSATGYVAAVLTTPTATTGDVRGTYALQTAAATGANRLMMRAHPQAYNIGSIAGLFGPTQFSNF